MIDLHCHILPELDDGSQSLEESLAMARMAVNSGVRAVASDAHSPRVRTPWMEDVRDLLAQEFSPRCARALLLDNPRKILKDEPITLAEPEWF